MTARAKGTYRRIRHYRAAESLVATMVERWHGGTDLRLVRKILRKHGIHPWSMLIHLEQEVFQSLARALRLPDWAYSACACSNAYTGDLGFHFKDSPIGMRSFPEGLVAPSLRFDRNARGRKLPWRAWTPDLSLFQMHGLRELPPWVSDVVSLSVTDCRSLKRLSSPLAQIEGLEISDCPHLEGLSRIGLGQPSNAWVQLANLPKLKRIRDGSRMGDLWIWRCPTLEGLSHVKVDQRLFLHGCHSLSAIQEVSALATLDVSDCPGLVGVVSEWEAPEGRFEPERRPGCSEVEQRREEDPEPIGSFPLFSEERGAVWPWPPGHRPLSGREDSIHRTMAVLRLGQDECLRAMARLPIDLQAFIRQELAHQADPPSAVRHAIRWLQGFGRQDRALALAVLAEAEGMGLGAVSIANGLASSHLDRLGIAFPRNWLRKYQVNANEKVGPDSLKCQVPGPMVLLEPDQTWIQAVDLVAVEGPLWVTGTLSIRDCPFLEVLPDALVVEGMLNIEDCPSLRRVPRRMEVRGDLRLRNLPRLAESRADVNLGGSLYLESVPRLKIVCLPYPVVRPDGWVPA